MHAVGTLILCLCFWVPRGPSFLPLLWVLLAGPILTVWWVPHWQWAGHVPSMGGSSLAVDFLVPIMGGHIVAPLMEGPSRWSLPVIAPLSPLPRTSIGGPLTSLAVSPLLSLPSSLAGIIHILLLTWIIPMPMHLWHQLSPRRLPCCVLLHMRILPLPLMSPCPFGIHCLLWLLLTQWGAVFLLMLHSPQPQNTGSVPPVATGSGEPPLVVPMPMGGGIPASIPGAAPPHLPFEGMVPHM